MADDHERTDETAEQFSYRASKDGKVFVAWHGKTVTTLKGEAARRFLSRIEAANPHEAQQIMARVTGNFKRGNERLASGTQ
jgi:hypothetical protein